MTYRGTAILGRASAQPDQMRAFVRRINASAPDVAPLYLEMGRQLAVRGDLAFAQAIYETSGFREAGAAHNYGGLGAPGPGSPGAAFATPEEGVLAHLQHLYAFATASPLPGQMPKVDPGFDMVQRGSAPYAGDLAGRWNRDSAYGQAVERILGEILMEPAAGEPYQITRAYLDTAGRSRPDHSTGPGGWQGVKGVVLHRTASSAADAWTTRRYVEDLSGGGPGSGHFVVDDQVILHLIPIGDVARHTPGRNLTHLGITVCEHNWGTGAWGETYRKLVWLTAYLVRAFQLSLSEVTGRFWWEPVHHSNDPTHLGWTLQEGRAGGLFDWNQFIADVQARLAVRESIGAVDVQVVGPGMVDCPTGLLIDAVPYVPIESYTACLIPEATVRWSPKGTRVLVELPAPEPVVQVQAEPAPQPAPTVEVAIQPAPPPQPLRGRRPARPIRPARPACRARNHRKW